MSNLQMRLITAAVLIVVSLTATWAGGVVFRGFSLLVGAAIYYEWQILTRTRQTSLARGLGWLLYALIAVLLVLDQPEALVFSTILTAVIVLILLGPGHAGWLAGGFLYALAAPVTLSFIRDGQAGLQAVLFLYGVVWATDSAAYFSGRAFGGPKLAPKLSPNKTWSGAIGGVIAALSVGLIMAWLSPNFSLSFISSLIFAFVLSVVSQMGDIGESWLKRHFNAKDSGTLLPGHGGFMDRADGLIVGAVVFYVLRMIL